jgi:hypothetical protein
MYRTRWQLELDSTAKMGNLQDLRVCLPISEIQRHCKIIHRPTNNYNQRGYNQFPSSNLVLNDDENPRTSYSSSGCVIWHEWLKAGVAIFLLLLDLLPVSLHPSKEEAQASPLARYVCTKDPIILPSINQ